jgi:hypothetical protein
MSKIEFFNSFEELKELPTFEWAENAQPKPKQEENELSPNWGQLNTCEIGDEECESCGS